MTPVKQQYKHNPPETYGDCHRAALASLLDLPIEQVPHFMDGLSPDEGEAFETRQDEFLNSRGLDCIRFPVQAESLGETCYAANVWNPDKLFLLGGESKNGVGHTVVAGKDGVVHDPALDNSGIIGPMSDGCFWITYIVRKI